MTKVTVLMPVYNGERYLRAAMESILNQNFSDFEFLIINDGSTDRTEQIILDYRDARIRYVSNGRNLGLIASLNKGLDIATGEYVARMDADDISCSGRLQRQVQFMDANPGVGVCGSYMRIFGDGPRLDNLITVPLEHEAIRTGLLFANSMNHSTVILRKKFFDIFHLRYANFRHAEDYELWTRCVGLFDLHNIPEFLVDYRIAPTSVTQSNPQALVNTVGVILRKQFSKLGLVVTDKEVEVFSRSASEPFTKANDLDRLRRLYEKIHDANRVLNLYPQDILLDLLRSRWFRACTDFDGSPLIAFKLYQRIRFGRNLYTLGLTFFPGFLYRTIRRTLSFMKRIVYSNLGKPIPKATLRRKSVL